MNRALLVWFTEEPCVRACRAPPGLKSAISAAFVMLSPAYRLLLKRRVKAVRGMYDCGHVSAINIFIF